MQTFARNPKSTQFQFSKILNFQPHKIWPYYSLKRNRFVEVVGPSLAGLWPLRSSTDSSAVIHYITVLIFVRAMNKSGILGSFLDKIEKRHNNTCLCMVGHVASVRINRVRLLNSACGQLNRENVDFPVPVRA